MSLSDQLLTRLKNVECPDATYPARNPAIVLAQGQGSLVLDADGREYIDLCAGFGVLALGHNPEALAPHFARRGQLGEAGTGLAPIVHGMGDVYASQAKVELLEQLIAVMPPHLTRGALALTGGQAVEMAVKTALLASGRSGFIVFAGAYHGLDLGILPLTAKEAFRQPFDEFLPKDRVRTLPLGAGREELEAACASLETAGHGVAAILVEPVQGRAGVRPAPSGWLGLLRQVADQAGALLIYDEVFTGLGRTGRLTHADEVPCDLLCLGKALGGGLPLSACLGTEKAMGAWPESQGEALHTGTFFGHPLACELALTTVREIVGRDLPARARRVGAWALGFLREALAYHPGVREVRGQGLMIALELRQDGHGALLMDRARECGVIALASGERGESLSVTPALTIPEELLAEALRRLITCLVKRD